MSPKQEPVKQSGFQLGGDSEDEFEDDEEINDDFYNHQKQFGKQPEVKPAPPKAAEPPPVQTKKPKPSEKDYDNYEESFGKGGDDEDDLDDFYQHDQTIKKTDYNPITTVKTTTQVNAQSFQRTMDSAPKMSPIPA